ncbi:alpha/beta hydrolase fold [Shewanella psychrophila]|uniref:Alpha/beta hydrolase fold n=1 Tax=Shewanella psychrophila TaxID=225848 RepID=A0A1S6HVQ7_9GAMM|nr:alpha/beta hydrolase [Shewanella psychrophila]AQS39542.1 alpha/beta hydrolase fold [Shewanella psychrophila]
MRGIISPKLEGFLEQANVAIAEGKRNQVEFTPSLIRGNLNKLAAFMTSSPEIAFIEDRFLKFEGRELKVRVYSPAPNEKLPIILHFHGGGHMCGSVELYDPISRNLAAAAHSVVICVEYRLAPEHPYPAAIHDCQHALINYKQVLGNVCHNNIVAIVGDSAGGAICTTLAMNGLKNSAIKIDKQILIYPSVDYTMSCPSVQSNGKGFLLEQDKMRWYFQQYFQQSFGGNSAQSLKGSIEKCVEQDIRASVERSDGHSFGESANHNLRSSWDDHPNLNFDEHSGRAVQHEELIKKASPLYGPFSKAMPETLIITAGCDPLRDEGQAYANALSDAGIQVQHHQFDGMIHAYMLLHELVKDECNHTYHLIAKFMN